MVVIAPSSDERELFISRLAVRLGFAKVPSDAKKIIRKDIYSFDLLLPTSFSAVTTTFAALSSRHSSLRACRKGHLRSRRRQVTTA